MNRKTTVAILATCITTFGLSAASCQETVEIFSPSIQAPSTDLACYAGPGNPEQPGIPPCEPSGEPGTGVDACANLPGGAPGCPDDNPLPPPECPTPVDCTGNTEPTGDTLPHGIPGNP